MLIQPTYKHVYAFFNGNPNKASRNEKSLNRGRHCSQHFDKQSCFLQGSKMTRPLVDMLPPATPPVQAFFIFI